jgi:hypothetical protein
VIQEAHATTWSKAMGMTDIFKSHRMRASYVGAVDSGIRFRRDRYVLRERPDALVVFGTDGDRFAVISYRNALIQATAATSRGIAG